MGSIGVLFLVISASTYPVFGKELTYAFSPTSLLFLSEMMAGIFVCLFFGVVPVAKKLGKLEKRERMPLLISCLINSTLAPYLWFRGLHATSAVNAELFSRGEMLFMIVLSVLVVRETFTRRHFASLCIILFGLTCVALEGFTAGFHLQVGDMFIIASALAYAVGGIIVKRYLHGIVPEVIILSRAALAATAFTVLLPLSELSVAGELRMVDTGVLLALVGYSFVSRFLGVYGFYQGIEYLQVRTVSMAGTLSVVGGMFFAVVYLGETIHWYQIVGGVFIIFGVIMAQKVGIHKSKRRHRHHITQHHRHHI